MPIYARRSKMPYLSRLIRANRSNFSRGTQKRMAKVAKKVYQREQKKTVEPQFIDITTSTLITTAPQVINISGIVSPSGDDGSTTVQSIKNLSIQIKGNYSNGDATDDRQIRMVLVRQKRPKVVGTLPVWDDVFTGTQNDMVSFPTQLGKQYYDIVKEWKFILTGTTEGHPSIKQLNYYKKLGNITKWSDDTATNVSTNHYVLMIVSTDGAGGITHETNIRLTYIDQ